MSARKSCDVASYSFQDMKASNPVDFWCLRWCHILFLYSRRWNTEKNSRVNKVGGAVNGVDDPGGLVSEDAGLPCSHRLLPYEPETHILRSLFLYIYKTDTNSIHSNKLPGVSGFKHTHSSSKLWCLNMDNDDEQQMALGSAGGGASHLCVGNFSFTDWMMSCSTCWSVWVTKSTEELFVITFRSSRRASRTTWPKHIWFMKLLSGLFYNTWQPELLECS